VAARSGTSRAAAAAAGGLPPTKCGHWGHVSKRTHRPCGAQVITGTHACQIHAGKPLEQARAEGAVRVQFSKWTLDGHDGSDIDPKVEILRMIAFWKWKANLAGTLLERAYKAADRLRQAHKALDIIHVDDPEFEYDSGEDGYLLEHPALQTARQDLEAIFSQGGVTALVGKKYDVDRNGRVFAVDEGIRGLVQLEKDAHTMLAKCCALAVQAKVADAKVQLAEQVGVMIQAVILGVLRDLGVAADIRVMEIIAFNIDQVAGSPALAA
jgi:hypothetical protein